MSRCTHSAARETESREVLTRLVETEMTCCWLETINNRRLFSLIKEHRRAIEKMSGGAGQFFLMSCDLPYYAAIDWQVDVLSTPVLDEPVWFPKAYSRLLVCTGKLKIMHLRAKT